MEMSDETCREIMTRNTYAESDLSLMEHMQERNNRHAPPPTAVQRNSGPSPARKYQGYQPLNNHNEYGGG